MQRGERHECESFATENFRLLDAEWRRQLQLGLPLDLAQRTSHLRTVEQ